MININRAWLRFGTFWLYLLWTAAQTTIGCHADDSPIYIGRASCASATCHGGISGQGPAWNSSLRTWEATDLSHSGAGTVLLNERSQQMVATLVGSSLDVTILRSTLMDRCVSCHSPILAESQSLTTLSDADWRRQIHEGVNCEACHGPASKWLDLHTLQAADARVASEASGMLPTKPWLVRTDNCLRCHIGSRPPDGIVRDMNHDLIAAGHPALQFDMGQHQARLPAHWAVSPDKLLTAEFPESDLQVRIDRQRPEFVFELPTPLNHHLSRLRTLSAAAKLSLARMDASRHGLAPNPEFAEYNCFACHQNLQLSNDNLDRLQQELTWYPVYNQPTLLGNDLAIFDRQELSMESQALESKLVALAAAAEQCIVEAQLANLRDTNQIKLLDAIPALDDSRTSETKP